MHIPVIVLSGKRDQQSPQQLLRSGAAQYLRKPVSVDDLVREIGRFIELREHGSARRDHTCS
jgi:CheY-like chemotaxis protein